MSEAELPVTVTYSQPRWRPEWAVPEVPVPEATWHDLGIEYVRSLLLAWAERQKRDVLVARNLGIRWVRSEPRAGFDPDLCVIEPPPGETWLSSLRLWEEDHHAPWLAVEIVSPGHPYKDYLDTPARCVASGVGELWVFDPVLAGPKSSGGPFALQIWTRDGETMTRVHAGNVPGRSPALGAWLVPVGAAKLAELRSRPRLSSPGDPRIPPARLEISDAEVGGAPWPTLEAQRSAARSQEEQQRADVAERQLADLQRQIQALKAGRE